jgi:hypothetical protein
MVNLQLEEYNWNGSKYASTGTTIMFGGTMPGHPSPSPGPKSVSKSVDVQWRIAHRGRRKLKKAKFRTRETMTWTLQGSCQFASQGIGGGDLEDLGELIEWASKRNSKWNVVIDTDTPKTFLVPDPASTAHTWEVVFVVMKSLKFTQTEGRIGWFDYTLELERINCENIDGYSDPWTCTPTPPP